MPRPWWTRKNLVLAAAILSLALIGFVAIGLSYPEPAASAALGPDWQCSRLALVFTTCSRMKHSQAVVVPVRIAKAAACSRLRT
jgi:adenine-specific DNA methylase